MIPSLDPSVIELNVPSEATQRSQETSLHSFLASLTVSTSIFDAEIALFILLKNKLTLL